MMRLDDIPPDCPERIPWLVARGWMPIVTAGPGAYTHPRYGPSRWFSMGAAIRREHVGEMPWLDRLMEIE